MTLRLPSFFVTLLLVVLFWTGLSPRPAYAAGYVVNSLADNNTAGDSLCTLREAIESANNAGNGDCGVNGPADDTITFSVSGTIVLGSTLPNIVSGQGALTIDGGGNIAINGNNSVRVFYVDSGANLTLQNLTVANGAAIVGGGIFNNGGTLTITNSTFSGNTATRRGGGLANIGTSSTLIITDSLFENNTASGTNSFDGGGAIHTDSDLTIQNSTFRNNIYNGNAHGGGAILAIGGTVNISESLFEDNRAGGNGGGAIAITIDFGTPILIVDRSTFRNNFTYGNFGDGGAISANGDMTITASTFNGNYTSGSDSFGNQNGGAVSAINSILEMVNVTFSDNRANGNGGALYYRNDYDALLNNVTIASNQADADNNATGDGGGIFVEDIGAGSILTVRNAIVALNSDPSGGAPNCSGNLQANYTLIGNSIGCTLLVGSANNIIGSNPKLGPLANNGGPTQTRALLAGSLAIDAADPSVGGPGACATTDQRGMARFDGNYDSVVRCDMGAYEFDQPAPPPPPSSLPATGFAPGRLTTLPIQPAAKAYVSYNDLKLEIPALGVSAPIVGVLKSNGSWDVSWLGTSVGWLEGSAFPTWAGNTVLTGHVWNADNTPGIFNQIKKLKYGDRFYIHAFGQTYVYEVRENTWLVGDKNVDKVFKHEEYDWVTLLTCEGYNPLTGNYLFRRIVRAVLVNVR